MRFDSSQLIWFRRWAPPWSTLSEDGNTTRSKNGWDWSDTDRPTYHRHPHKWSRGWSCDAIDCSRIRIMFLAGRPTKNPRLFPVFSQNIKIKPFSRAGRLLFQIPRLFPEIRTVGARFQEHLSVQYFLYSIPLPTWKLQMKMFKFHWQNLSAMS